MITLGIETSGRSGSVALAADGVLLAARELSASGRRHARTLVPEIGILLAGCDLTPREIDLVAVSIGPGSFTGLRVGVVCAKTFAYAVGCSLIGVDTFLAVASRQEDLHRIWIIDDALRGDLFAGEYAAEDGQWGCVSPPRLIALADWRVGIDLETPVSGPGVDKLSAELAGLRLATGELRSPHAREIALLGEASARAGRVDNPWTLEPLYIRRSAAEEKADQSGATAP